MGSEVNSIPDTGTITRTDIAHVVWETHRAYQAVLGDPLPAPPWQTIGPELKYRRDMVVVMVELILNGASAEEVHGSWCESMIAAGWRWGAEKDPDLRTHPCICGWDDLPPEAQTKVLLAFGVVNGFAMNYRVE